MKLAIVQYQREDMSIEAATQKGIEFIQQAKQNQADLVLFPECFLTGYDCPDICKQLLPLKQIKQDSDYIEWCESALADDCEAILKIQAFCKQQNIATCITAFTKGKQAPQNSAILINKTGEIILKYSKVHTCDFDWERYLESGEAFHVVDFDGIKIGVMICYDREYPESARELMLQGAQLILVPNDCTDMPYRCMELAVAAMQNGTVMAMANPNGINKGCSCVYHPMVWESDDLCLAMAPELEATILYVDIDMQAISNYCMQEDIGKYRKINSYQHLTKKV